MIGAVGQQPELNQMGAARGAGKRADAVGQQAKAAVAVAREAAGDMPRNAQGLAASALARGIDPASLFAARLGDGSGGAGNVEPPGIVDDGGAAGGMVADGVGEAPADATGVETALADEARDEAAAEKPLASGGIVISEDPSLALLLDADEQKDI